MLSTKNKISRAILTVSVLVVVALASFLRPVPHYAYLSLSNPAKVQIDYLWQADINQRICQQKLVSLDELVLADCPDCTITKQQCLSKLNQQQLGLFNSQPQPFPSIRLPYGIITYQSADPQLALQACLKAQNLQAHLSHKSTCLPSHFLPPTNMPKPYIFWLTIFEIGLSILSVAAVTWGICYLILRNKHMHEHFSLDYTDSGPQKFHTQATPRVGGFALYAGLLVGLLIEDIFHSKNQLSNESYLFFLLASSPVFLGGLIEDITKNVSVANRLLFSMLSASTAIWLLGAVIDRTDIGLLDNALIWSPIAIAFTVLGISGVCNAMNIIDGYHGISAGYGLIALIAISVIAFLVNDHLVLSISTVLIGALLAFLWWNWPHGKIFMGDGGAYLLGFSLAELCILLLYRNASVSPWFAASLMAYPIIETLYTMFRRKFLSKAKTGQPDAEHLHQLIFKKIVLKGKAITPDILSHHNCRVSIFICLPAAFIAIVAVLFWQSSDVLMPFTLVGCVAYVLIYRKLLS